MDDIISMVYSVYRNVGHPVVCLRKVSDIKQGVKIHKSKHS